MRVWQDIQLGNVFNWQQFQSYWKNQQYEECINLLNDGSLSGKWQDANLINVLTEELVRLQNQDDPTFKDGAPILSVDTPQNPNKNNIWFEVI